MDPLSQFGTIFVLPRQWLFCHDGGRFATTAAVDAFGRHGAIQDLSQTGVCRTGWEGVMAVGRFCRNAVGPPEWECEAMGPVVWV